MKKKILLIGNNDGLPGVKIDLINYRYYFCSSKGGGWNSDEIIEFINPSKLFIELQIAYLKLLKLDYLIVIFSGHGGMERETVLELNEKGEQINESEFSNIAPKQLTIFDCCRALSKPVYENVNVVKKLSDGGVMSNRKLYEERINQALPQQIKMYSCAIGEYSNDTSRGGVYSKNLLYNALLCSDHFISIGKVHDLTANSIKKDYPDQNPELIIPKLLSHQLLIFGVNA